MSQSFTYMSFEIVELPFETIRLHLILYMNKIKTKCFVQQKYDDSQYFHMHIYIPLEMNPRKMNIHRIGYAGTAYYILIAYMQENRTKKKTHNEIMKI